jgi:hypothetical protein
MKNAMVISFINRRTTIVLILSSLISTSIFSQKVSSDDLSGINGKWEGKLSYVDYGDDKTEYSLNTMMEATWENGSGKLKFEFKEPNGKLVYSTEKIKLISNEEFKFDSKWQIVDFSQNGESWKLILESNGKDNNKESTLREVINYENEKLVIKKMVMYKGTDSFFMRNSYHLTRASSK